MRTEVFLQVVTHGKDKDSIREEYEKLSMEILSWPEVDSVSLKLEEIDADGN